MDDPEAMTALQAIRARDAESGATWFTGPASFTAQAARDRRALLAEVERLREDAARYRWLRSEDTATSPLYYPFWQEFNAKLCREEHMDALIDSAMTSRMVAK